jgi:hypothetical protein
VQARCTDPLLKSILRHYLSMPKEQERAIWTKVRHARAASPTFVEVLPPDEHVEDAGLFDDDLEAPAMAISGHQRAIVSA